MTNDHILDAMWAAANAQLAAIAARREQPGGVSLADEAAERDLLGILEQIEFQTGVIQRAQKPEERFVTRRVEARE